MSALKAVFKRELASYFTSPLAYIFTVIFLLLTAIFTFAVGFFFDRNQASLQIFFFFHPFLYLILVPAVGMHLWSEERRLGTLELLFTMPVKPSHCIIAKFLSSWLFIGLALLLTFPMVWAVNYLGSPDNGVIFCGYVGSFLLAGAYLAITSMTSTFSRSQIICFILAVTICIFLAVIGFEPFLNMIRNWGVHESIISFCESIGVFKHFESLQRGVIDLRDLTYFATLIVAPLCVTGIVLKSHRAG